MSIHCFILRRAYAEPAAGREEEPSGGRRNSLATHMVSLAPPAWQTAAYQARINEGLGEYQFR